MPKDYAKNRTKKGKRSRRKQKTTMHWKLWLFTLLAVALFIYVLLHLGHDGRSVKSIKMLPKQIKAAVVIKKKSPSNAQFDFYTMLPKEQVKVVTSTPHGVQFVLQIASVKKFSSADRLKAELALLGFDAYIDKVTEKDVVWSRINVGPYFTKQAALADQKRLLQSKIKSVLGVKSGVGS